MKRKEKQIYYIIGIIFIVAVTMVIGFNSKKENSSASVRSIISGYSVLAETSDVVYATSTELIVEKNGKKETYNMPKDEFYLSIAPYYNETHPCNDHYITKCDGELKNETFQVTIKDSNKDIIYDETVESTARGFIDLWVPRNKNVEITVTHNTSKSSQTITTYNTSQTCLTNFKLG